MVLSWITLIALICLLPVLAIVGIVYLIARASKNSRASEHQSAEEAEAVARLSEALNKMERRVANLEVILDQRGAGDPRAGAPREDLAAHG